MLNDQIHPTNLGTGGSSLYCHSFELALANLTKYCAVKYPKKFKWACLRTRGTPKTNGLHINCLVNTCVRTITCTHPYDTNPMIQTANGKQLKRHSQGVLAAPMATPPGQRACALQVAAQKSHRKIRIWKVMESQNPSKLEVPHHFEGIISWFQHVSACFSFSKHQQGHQQGH